MAPARSAPAEAETPPASDAGSAACRNTGRGEERTHARSEADGKERDRNPVTCRVDHTNADTQTDADPHSKTNSDTDGEADAEANSTPDTETHAKTEADAVSDPEEESDAETETDA